jgi:hypothetical protein
MKREFELVGTGVILPISRGTLLDVTRRFLHMDELDDGTWRITVSKSLSETITAIEEIRITGVSNPRSMLDFIGIPWRAPVQQIVCLGGAPGRKGMIHFDDNGKGMWKVLMYVPNVDPSILRKVDVFKINRDDGDEA